MVQWNISFKMAAAKLTRIVCINCILIWKNGDKSLNNSIRGKKYLKMNFIILMYYSYYI